VLASQSFIQVLAVVATSAQVSFLLDILVLAMAALVFSLIFARLGLSVVAGQILAGMIVGPYVLGWVTDPLVLNEISGIGVVLLFFIIGLELDPTELRRLAGKVTLLTVLEIVIAFSFGLLASYLLKLGFLEAVIFSMTASITSTAIVGRIFLSRKLLQTPESSFLLGLLVIEDIVAVVFLIVLSSITSTNIGNFPYFVVGTTPSSKGFFAATEAVLSGLALIGLGYVVARYLATRIINYLSYYEEEFEEIPFLFALGLALVFAVVSSLLGYSPAIGAFIIGLSIRGKHSKFLERRVTPIKDLFLVLFFVSIGSLIDPFPSLEIGLPIIAVFALLIAGKFCGGYTIGRIFLSGMKLNGASGKASTADPKKSHANRLPSATAFGAWLIPRGEFSLVIGQLALALGLVGEPFFSLIGMSVLVTAIVASILQRVVEPRRAPSAYPIKGESDGES